MFHSVPHLTSDHIAKPIISTLLTHTHTHTHSVKPTKNFSSLLGRQNNRKNIAQVHKLMFLCSQKPQTVSKFPFLRLTQLCVVVLLSKQIFGEVGKKLEPENFHSFKCKIIKTNVSMLRELPDLVNMPSVAQVVATTQTVQLDTFLIFWWSLTGNSIFFPLRSFSAAMTQVCVPSEANFQNIYLCSLRLLVHNEQREPQLNT